MYKYAIRNKAKKDKVIGYLYYDEVKREYDIEIPNGVKSEEAPPIIAEFIQRGEKRVGKDWSFRWVKQRVVPSERQNIGQILRENGMQYYDEFPLLIKNQGRSCQDDCYLSLLPECRGRDK